MYQEHLKILTGIKRAILQENHHAIPSWSYTSLRDAFSDPEIISIWSPINALKVYSVMRLELESSAMIYALEP